MLGSIRKFSSSIYAKIFLIIVAIPFIFWGMGPVFQGGKLNTIVEIGKEKISTDEFVNFLKFNTTDKDTKDENYIEKKLSMFIGEKLIFLEAKNLEIRLSDNSLSKIIRNDTNFKKNNEFSRIEYEKFLVNQNLSAALFESNMTKEIKRQQLFDFVLGGIVPSNFLVNQAHNEINQKRNIEVINLNEIFKKKINFTDDQIISYYNENKISYQQVFKTLNFVELFPKNLTGTEEFSDLFFEKIDGIDDLIVDGKDLNFVINKFNLPPFSQVVLNEFGKDKASKNIQNFSNEIIKKIFTISEIEPTLLLEEKDKYFIFELKNTENFQRKINDPTVKNEIIINLQSQIKRELISKIISKINNNNFKKNDFDKFSKDENVSIEKIKIKNKNDDKILKKELVKQIYLSAPKKVTLVADRNLDESFLIYLDEVYNVSIDKSSDNYDEYMELTKRKISNNLYNSYNFYLQNKYKININYNALNNVKNNFK